MTNALRILVVDDQPITRTGLRALLGSLPGLEIVGEARDGAQAVASASELRPDVVLMDLRMPVMNGIEATRRIHRSSPGIGILVLTVFEDDTSVFPAIRAGARGYLLKNSEQDELVRAIQTVASGGAIFSPGIAQRVLTYLTLPHPAPVASDFDVLTPREHAILELIALGLSNLEIGERLGLSPKTISNHVSNVLSKLQAADRAKLMLMALDAGLGRDESEPDGPRGE